MLKEKHAGDMSAIASTEMASMSMREEQQNRSAMSRRADDKAGAISNKIASKVRYSQRATVDIEVLKAVLCRNQGNLRIGNSSEHAKRRHAAKYGAAATVSRTSHVGTIGSARRQGTGL